MNKVLKMIRYILFIMIMCVITPNHAVASDNDTGEIQTTVDRYQYGDNYLTGKTKPHATVAFIYWGTYGGNNWKSQYAHYAKADDKGNFKLTARYYSSGQTLDFAAFDENGKKFATKKILVFKGSYSTLDEIFDTSHELTGKTVKNTKVEVFKDGQVIASGTFNDEVKLALPSLPAGTFLSVKLTTGSNVDIYKKMVQANQVSFISPSKWSTSFKGKTGTPGAKIALKSNDLSVTNRLMTTDSKGEFIFSLDKETSNKLNKNYFQVLEPVYDNVIFEAQFNLRSTAPTIHPFTQLSTSVSGTATPESIINILDGEGRVIGEGQTDSNGVYDVPVSKLIGGDLITVKSFMADNPSETDQSQEDVQKVFVEEIDDSSDTINGVSTFGHQAVVEVQSNSLNNTVMAMSKLSTKAVKKKYGPFSITPGKDFKLKTGKLQQGSKVTITLLSGNRKVALPAVTVKKVVTSPLAASQVKVTNNKGKNDTVTIKGIKKQSVIKVFKQASGGKAIAQQAASSSNLTISLKQLGQTSGTLYISIKEPGLKEGNRVPIRYQGEKSDALKASQVKINNLKNKNDIITVSKLKKKDVIKVYSTSGKLLSTSKPATSSSIKLYVKQVGTKSGKVYITRSSDKMLESGKQTISFKGEPSASLKSNQINIVNNKKKKDVVTVSKLTNQDVVKIYHSSGKLMGKSTANKGKVVKVTFKQLGAKGGKLYFTVTGKGMSESSKTVKAFKAERK
ncbi:MULTISPECIES: Ig-like domain-containing protein [Bacillus]|uniref:Ig-like domain-containing protein n=1 Tax=Bacillus TaxID=1386 RepID=UPI00203B67B3|nr:Ig-like domain-containing protein [Bacillus safensis]MCM3138390.1 Ig-like domain-containing protein [Bacillus safensis]UXC32458.1 Ig-like domain-containing protein [Bacillus safensis]